MKKALLYAFVILAIQFVAQLFVSIAYMFINKKAVEVLPPLWNIVVMVLFSLLTIVVFLWAGWFEASRTYLRSRPWAVLLWCVIASLGALVPSMALQGLLPEWSGWAKEIVDQTSEQLEGLMTIPGGYMVVALLPPLVEEMVFRGCVLRSLLQWKPQRRWAMIALSALIFALVHLNPAQMPHTFLIGLLLGWLYMRSGSIVPGVVYHWANNTAAYVMFHVYHNPQSLTDIIGPGTRPLLLALLFSLCIFVPAIIQLNQRMRVER